MASQDKQILERAISLGLLTKESATQLARLRHARKEQQGQAPAIEKLAVELGLITPADATRLRESAADFLESGVIAGYQLLGKIGAGTMGVVYKAKQVSLDRLVAIKILSPHLSHKADYVERFLREARAVARLNHPNVISGIDVGEADGVRYFVMEYASGTAVGRLLARGGAMSETRTARVAVQIARALEHAHAAGLVHRDVKPDNILLTKDGIAKLCDLGLAKDKPEKGKTLGTPAYISPEQAEGYADVDIRADLYSFGATLYHMLTGDPPFSGTSKLVLVKHLTEEPRPIREIDPSISESFADIVMRLLRKDPEARYQSPAHLLRALDEYEQEKKKTDATPRAPRRSTRRRRRR